MTFLFLGEANMYVAVTEELCIPVNDYLLFRKGTVLDVHRAKYEKLIIID